jgi:hypothetical protein
MTEQSSDIFFANVKMKELSAEASLPAKFLRMLDQADLKSMVKGKRVLIKMHLGGNLGYTTIHPMFVRQLVKYLKQAKVKSIVIADGNTHGSEARGYTYKTVGARLISLFGFMKRKTLIPIGFKTLEAVEVANDVLHTDFLLVFSHVKGHGACGFGAAGKNIAMGCVPGSTRGKMHALEGGISWDETKCKHCNKCIEECPNKANKFDDKGKYSVFWHNCKFCRHCLLACPEGALSTSDANFADFQKGMALVVSNIMDRVGPSNTFFINMLMNITIFCDCWGFSSPSLVPDIGILASKDIVAIERATLDMIKVENLNEDGLPEGRSLGDGNHLFEKIHGKDPYVMSQYLNEMGKGNLEYLLKPID